jgi:hypothetical protein
MNFRVTAVSNLEAIANRFLKSWCGLSLPTTVSILYRSQKNKGLELTPLTLLLKKMQVIKCHIFQNSSDPDIKLLQSVKADAKTKGWNPSKELKLLVNEVKRKKNFGGQTSRLGLGFVKRKLKGNDIIKSERKDITSTLATFEEEKMLVKLHDFAKQGSWLKWDELMELDLSWKNLIYCIPPKLVSFYLGAVAKLSLLQTIFFYGEIDHLVTAHSASTQPVRFSIS